MKKCSETNIRELKIEEILGMWTPTSKKKGHKLAGERIYLTGVIPGFTRKRLSAIVKSEGGILLPKSDHLKLRDIQYYVLVIGTDKDETIVKKANKLGIHWTHAYDFMKLLGYKI